MNYYVSSGCFLSRDLEAILTSCEMLGCGLELSSAVTYDPAIEQVLRGSIRPRRLLIHNYFPPPATPFFLNLASLDGATHRRSVALCKKAIHLCRVMGVPFYSVHAGSAFDYAPEDLGNPLAQKRTAPGQTQRARAYLVFTETVLELAEFANSQGVGLLVENNVRTVETMDALGECPLLLADPDEIVDFFHKVDGSDVRLLLDAGHAKVTAATLQSAPEEFIERLGPHIGGFHLSDNDGLRDTNSEFDDGCWFAPLLPSYNDRPMVVEVYSLEPERILEQCRRLEGMVR